MGYVGVGIFGMYNQLIHRAQRTAPVINMLANVLNTKSIIITNANKTATAGEPLSEEWRMKPCDCRTLLDIEALEYQGLSFNSKSISVLANGVLLEIDPYVRIKLDHTNFKRFAEWYLTDQSQPAVEPGEAG